MSKMERLIYKNIGQRHQVMSKQNKLIESELNALSSVILIFSFVHPLMIEESRKEPEYQYIFSLLRKSKESGEILKELLDVNEQKRNLILNELKQHKKELILGKQLMNYKYVLKSKRRDREEIARMILQNSKERIHSTVKNKVHILDEQIFSIENPLIHLSSEILEVEVEGHDLIEYLSYIIYQPKTFILTELMKLDDAWKDYPLKWCSNILPLNINSILFNIYKDGEELSSYFIKRYNPFPYDKIVKMISNHYFQEISTREEILREALDCYIEKKYFACVTLTLTLIEGLLRDYSKRYDNKYKNLYKKGSEHKTVIHKDGETESEATIGTLLKLTSFGDLFETDFISYFCDELYLERNPVLHGEDQEFGTKQNAAKKIATLEFILFIMNDHIETIFNDTINSMISDDEVELLIQGKIDFNYIADKFAKD